jgi:predicted anti-sigma-YlaC factor YlaD
MECAEIQKNMMDFIEGELEPSLFKNVKEHIDSCAQCAALSSKLSEVFSYIQHDKQATDDLHMFAAIQHALARPDIAQHRHFRISLIQSLSFAAMLALVIITGIFIGKRYEFEKSVASDYQTELFYLNNIHMENQVIVPLSEESPEP